MADANKLIENQIKKINKVINDGCKIIGDKIKKTLIYNIQNTFYNLGYGDDHDLWDSITIKVNSDSPDEFFIDVFFDDTKINHTSWFGSEKLGIHSGDVCYTVAWINDGWSYINGSVSQRLNDVGKSPHFLEKTLHELENNKSWLEDFKKYLRDNGIEIN